MKGFIKNVSKAYMNFVRKIIYAMVAFMKKTVRRVK